MAWHLMPKDSTQKLMLWAPTVKEETPRQLEKLAMWKVLGRLLLEEDHTPKASSAKPRETTHTRMATTPKH